jgi:UDP-glucose 4-epimerase
VRILITGMAGELGTRVAQLLEADTRIDEVIGTDFDPPRRRVRRVDFHRVDPRAEERLGSLVREVDPTVLVHIGAYEPEARCSAAVAREMTESSARAVFGAAVTCRSLQRIVVRSGIEVYGRRRRSPLRADESVAPDPTTPFGRGLRHTEELAVSTGRRLDVPVTLLRFAPLVGPHFPSPLGRYLRLPAIAVSALGDLPFSLLHQEDAAAALVAAARRDVDRAVNVAGDGAVTPRQAARMGGRGYVPTLGVGWALARRLSDLAGAPVPDHLVELLVRGRTADASSAGEALGVRPAFSTVEVVKDLYEWASVTPLRRTDEAA